METGLTTQRQCFVCRIKCTMQSTDIKPADTKKMRIPFRLLLGIYVIVPILLTIVLADTFFFDNALRPYVNLSLRATFIYLFFFELPHIFASYISFADKEYLKTYKKLLLYHVPIILIAGCILTFFSTELAIMLIIGYTMYHAILQQTGIAKMLLGTKHLLHRYWSSLAVIIAISVQLYLVRVPTFTQIPLIYFFTFFWICVILFITFSTLIYLQAKPGIGKTYFAATSLMLTSAILFFILGYPFFAILVVRFPHDITAFAIYITHDTNRNAATINNSIYKFFAPLRIPILVLLPLLGIGLSYLLRYQLHIYDGIVYAGILVNFPHYYLEGYIWKHDTPHRKQLAFQP